jgi:hypothetical protein
MRNQHWKGPDNSLRDKSSRARRQDTVDADFDSANAPEEVFGEIGLVLVIVLGIVVALNMILVGLHIG